MTINHLRESEQQDAERRSSPRASVVYEAIRKEGDDELSRSFSGLAWSGLAAGLSMGFSLIAEGLLRSRIGDYPWRPLIAKFGYSVGFLIVVLGRQQLFTENTLTVILPLLQHKSFSNLMRVIRLWTVVLTANLAGAAVFAFVSARAHLFPPEALEAFAAIGHESMAGGFGSILLRGIFAGWLIALMVWLLPAAETGRISVIIIITYMVGLGSFSHVIAGSVETLFLVANEAIRLPTYIGSFLIPTLFGNIIGGVSLVAALNHAQATAD